MPLARPSTLEEVQTIVRDACRSGERIRAVGGQNSLSAVFDGDGLALHTDGLDQRLPLPPLRLGWDPADLVRVGCGMRVRALQQLLAPLGRMLENTPAFTDQTLAGAASTASHGTGRGLGAINDLVVSVDMVLDRGEHVRVEPWNGPTDGRRWDGELIQNDRIFHSVVVGLGAFGVQVSYILKTVPLIHLLERRYVTTLDEGLELLTEGDARHVGLLVSPYRYRGGPKLCCVTERVVHGQARGLERLAMRQRVWPLLFSKLPFDRPILAAASAIPQTGVRWMLNAAIHAPCRERLVAPGPTLMDNYPLNQCAPVHAFEASLPMDQARLAMDRLVALAESEAEQGRWLTAPIAVRTVGASRHHLSPTQGRESVVFEGISQRRSPWGRDVLRPFAESLDTLGGRPHFGLDIFTVAHREDLARLFPSFGAWQKTLHDLDPIGRFDNRLIDRLELRASSQIAA